MASNTSTLTNVDRKVTHEKCTGKACASWSCSNIFRFQPNFPAGSDSQSWKYYYKHRMRVANAVSQIDTTPPKTVIKYCTSKPSRTFASLDTRNISAKKITRAIGNQMLGPTKVDCWNLKFSNAHDKSSEKRMLVHRRKINEQTKHNLANLMRYSKVKTHYCRFEQLRQWESFVNKSKENALFDHCWKDPYYTPTIIHNKKITRPINVDKIRWIDYKDPHLIEFRCCHDWDHEEFDKMLKLLWELKCTDCPSLCRR